MSQLKFKDGRFNIMVVGDLHEAYPPDKKTEDMLRLINGMLDKYTPDLAVIMGDIASDYRSDGGVTRDLTAEEMKDSFKNIFSPYIDRGIPFAFVFGNHDDERIFSKKAQLEMIQSLGGCVITDTPGLSGCGNCNVTVKASDSDEDKLNLWFFDSLNRAADGSYDWVHPNQIAWYRKKSAELKEQNGSKPVPAIAFQHIPVPEEYFLLKTTGRLNPNKVRGNGTHDGAFYEIADKEKTVGYLGEGPCTPDENGGEFTAWKEQGDVFAAFFGHDHMNDFVGEYDGIILGQCKCAGFHIYGDGLRQGVRMINISEDDVRNIKTSMHYYRELYGTKCNSIKGINLLSDRVRHNMFVGLVAGAAVTAVVSAAAWICHDFRKKRKK